MRQIGIKQALLATAVLAVGALVSPGWSPSGGLSLSIDQRTGQGRATVDPGERRRRCTTNHTPRSGRRSGRRCSRLWRRRLRRVLVNGAYVCR